MNFFSVLIFSCFALSALSASSNAATLIEAETACATKQMRGGEGTPDRKLTAWGGACLGNDWGMKSGDWAQYPVEAPGDAAVLHLRYARQERRVAEQAKTPAPARFRIQIDEFKTDFNLPETGDWELWRWIAVPIGALNKGAHSLRLQALQDGAAVNIDALMLAPADQTPVEVSRPLLFDGSRHLRIQLSPGAKDLPMEQLFAVGEATYGFLKEYLGEEPSQHLTVNIIAASESRGDFVGHSRGFAMYLEEALIMDTSHNWVHEMTHCFQRESGNWPIWLSEGEAWLTYFEAENAVFGRAADKISFSPKLLQERLSRWRETLFEGNRNTLQQWGQANFPSKKVGAAYGFSNFILFELRQKFGPQLMQRYRALLREDFKRGATENNLSPEKRDGLVVARLGRAANADLRPLFRSWGFELE